MDPLARSIASSLPLTQIYSHVSTILSGGNAYFAHLKDSIEFLNHPYQK